MKLALDPFDSRLAWLCVAAAALVASTAQPALAQECASDDDCESDFECAKDASDSAGDSDRPPCADDSGDCEPPPEPAEPVEEPLGECVARRVTCELDSDCPAGLSCELNRSEQCAASLPTAGDAGIPEDAPDCTVTIETTGECVFELVECDDNADCEGGLVCTALGGERSCSSDPGMATCPPGADCPQPEPQPAPEPECSAPVIRSYCFPEPTVCEDDAACDTGTRCVQLPNDWEDDDDAPVGWQGVDKACFPEGFARAIEGSVGIAGGSASEDASDAKGDDSGGGSATGAPRGESNAEDADESDSGAASGDSCAVATPGAQREGLGWPYAFALAGLGLARRRRARRLKRA